MADISLTRQTTFAIIKESGAWLRLEWMFVIAESIKMNNSPTPSETFCSRLEFGSLWEQKHYGSVSDPIRLAKGKNLENSR